MNRFRCLCLICFAFITGLPAMSAQLSIKAVMPDGPASQSASVYLETLMRRMLTADGLADNDHVERFVLTAKVNVGSKNVAPSTPPRIVEKMDVTFFVGDVVENKTYASTSFTLTGIGTTVEEAEKSALVKIRPDSKQLQNFLNEAKAKIVSYYSDNCETQIITAKSLATRGQYDEAIFRLTTVPDICPDCYSRCLQEADSIYMRKMEAFNDSVSNVAIRDSKEKKSVAKKKGKANNPAKARNDIKQSWANRQSKTTVDDIISGW